ncbi:Uncharacterised protein [Vibrio cholerae]|nr:Uncharacterised protein [Vibrio cholerae]
MHRDAPASRHETHRSRLNKVQYPVWAVLMNERALKSCAHRAYALPTLLICHRWLCAQTCVLGSLACC